MNELNQILKLMTKLDEKDMNQIIGVIKQAEKIIKKSEEQVATTKVATTKVAKLKIKEEDKIITIRGYSDDTYQVKLKNVEEFKRKYKENIEIKNQEIDLANQIEKLEFRKESLNNRITYLDQEQETLEKELMKVSKAFDDFMLKKDIFETTILEDLSPLIATEIKLDFQIEKLETEVEVVIIMANFLKKEANLVYDEIEELSGKLDDLIIQENEIDFTIYSLVEATIKEGEF